MSIILELKTAEWTLRVRANKNENRLETLKKTLAARELHLPGSQILFSPPVAILLNEEMGTPEFSQSQLQLPEPVFLKTSNINLRLHFLQNLNQTPHLSLSIDCAISKKLSFSMKNREY